MTSIGHVGFEKILENVTKHQTESELGEILKVNIDLCQIYMFKISIQSLAFDSKCSCFQLFPHTKALGAKSDLVTILSMANPAVLFEYHLKVSKGAKIRNRYNQVPHLTQDTNGKVTNF